MAARCRVEKCDCLGKNCPGCFFPCETCGSTKCLVCRLGRDWEYDLVTFIPRAIGDSTTTMSNSDSEDEEIRVRDNLSIQEVIELDDDIEDAIENAIKTEAIIIKTENVQMKMEIDENLPEGINNVKVKPEIFDEVNEMNVDNSMQSDYVEDMDVDNNVNFAYAHLNLPRMVDVRSLKIVDGPEKENIEDTEMKEVKDTLMEIINSIEERTIIEDSSIIENTDQKIVDGTEEESTKKMEVVFSEATKKNNVENAPNITTRKIAGDILSSENKRAGEITVQKENCNEEQKIIKDTKVTEKISIENIGVVITEITEKDVIKKNLVENTIQSKINIENTKKFVVESIEDEIVESADKNTNESIEKETVENKDKNTEERIVNTHDEGKNNTEQFLNTDSHVLEQIIQNKRQDVIEITKDKMLKNPESPYLQGMKNVIHKNSEESIEEEIIKCLEDNIFSILEREIDGEPNKK